MNTMNKKITLTIDGKKINTIEGKNLLQVAHDNGFEIPSLCYHRKLSPTGACRLCVVKIKDQGMVMSCTVGVKEGMEVVVFIVGLGLRGGWRLLLLMMSWKLRANIPWIIFWQSMMTAMTELTTMNFVTG